MILRHSKKGGGASKKHDGKKSESATTLSVEKRLGQSDGLHEPEKREGRCKPTDYEEKSRGAGRKPLIFFAGRRTGGEGKKKKML